MSTNTIIVVCNSVLCLLVTALTLLPCARRATGGLVPAALQSAIGNTNLTRETGIKARDLPGERLHPPIEAATQPLVGDGCCGGG